MRFHMSIVLRTPRPSRVVASFAAAGFVALLAAGCNSNSSTQAASAPAPKATVTAADQVFDPNGVSCTSLDNLGYCPDDDPTTAPPATSAPVTTTTPSMTAAQQQAVESAQSYLSGGQGFSKKGLMKQLTSSFGEGFAKADAEFAVSYLHPDGD